MTAKTKKTMVKGILSPRITLVFVCPSWGTPDESSKTEPTLAMAVTQERSSSTPLLGVMYILINILKAMIVR